MVFNKTKRGLEKGAAIFSVVMYSIQILIYFVLTIEGIIIFSNPYGYYYGNIYYSYGTIQTIGMTYALIGIILLAFCIVGLILSAKLIKTPLQPDGIVKKRNGLRITLLVFSILSGNFITAGLLIAVLCLKDVKPAQEDAQPSVAVAGNNIAPAQANTSIDAKLAKLKEFKELGIIDDEAYKKAIAKIIKDALK